MFKANVIFATEIMEVFTRTFASNVCRYCTQDLNKLYVYEKCSRSYVRCTLFYENWLDITWELSISLPWIDYSKKYAPFQKTRHIATLDRYLYMYHHSFLFRYLGIFLMTDLSWASLNLYRDMRKHVFWHMRTARAQIRAFAVRKQIHCIPEKVSVESKCPD